MEDLDRMKKDLQELFDSQRLGVLATQDEGQPYTSLVAFASGEDLKQLFFATSRATRKYSHVSRDARAAMLIDNRSNEASDFRWARAVTALGRAREIPGNEKDEPLRRYLLKHPHLEEFVFSPSCAFLEINVDRYIVVTRFQNVREVQVRQ
jgi:nitroimidazol reductase NimA-like FMN-containing flavoprotein (pyridoxamine 5'-phosphate oxidase superfamily)